MIQIKNKVIISDPCYNRNTWCMTDQDNMLEGNYNYFVDDINDEDWGNRIKSIEIIHENYERPKQWNYKNDLVGVDSGQAGIFCDTIYPKEEDTGKYNDLNSFYGKCCDATLSKEQFGIIENSGIVSSSGYGDGQYTCFIQNNEQNKCIGVRIVFINE